MLEQKSQPSSNAVIKTIFGNVGLLSSFFLFGGMLKVFSYYKPFGINIFEFIDIKEVLILFADNLLAYFIIICFVSLFLITYSSSKRLYRYTAHILFLLSTLIYLIVRQNVYWYEIVSLNIFVWLLSILVLKLIIRNKGDQQNLSSDHSRNQILLVFFITLVTYSSVSGINEYFKVRYRGYYSKTKLWNEKGELISNTNKYYIGKTNEFVFLYDDSIKVTEIIPLSSVKKFVFNGY